ncbi:hypothetical protein KSP39_PZI013772 [Platanthera zijinensis]|uniref:Secreted protein n=1 Tax=Platanthera zijinensis TaxID=2320716 RepID=A0AAP0BCF7_9ASPA
MANSCHTPSFSSSKFSSSALLLLLFVLRVAEFSSTVARPEAGLFAMKKARPGPLGLEGSTILKAINVLAKGRIPPSGPSKKGHASPETRRFRAPASGGFG